MAKKGVNLNKILKNKITVILAGVLIIIVVSFQILSYGINKKGWDNSLVRKLGSSLPVKVEKVGNMSVSYLEYLRKLDPLVTYQKNFNNVNFSSDEGKNKLKELKETVLSQLAEEKIIAKEASIKKITVTQKELDDSFNDLIKSNGGEDKVKENLNKYYNGMTLSDFKSQYKDKLLRQKLSDAIVGDIALTEGTKKIADELLVQIKNGADFAELAKKNSQDASASNGGDLGLFGKGKMVPEFEKAAFALPKGGVSEVVKTVYGYHIIKVTDKKGDEIKASHILIKTKDLNEWLKEKNAEYGVKRYIKI